MSTSRLLKLLLSGLSGLVVVALTPAKSSAAGTAPSGGGTRVGIPIDEDPPAAGEGAGRHLPDRLIEAARSGNVAPARGARSGNESRGERGEGNVAGNVQANDPALDHITTFDPRIVLTRPFEFATESETSAV